MYIVKASRTNIIATSRQPIGFEKVLYYGKNSFSFHSENEVQGFKTVASAKSCMTKLAKKNEGCKTYEWRYEIVEVA